MESKKKHLGNPSAEWCDISCDNLVQIGKDKGKKYCQLASNAQGWSVETKPYYCSICLESAEPKQLGNTGIKIATNSYSLWTKELGKVLAQNFIK